MKTLRINLFLICCLAALRCSPRTVHAAPPEWLHPPPPEHETIRTRQTDDWQQVPRHRLLLSAVLGARLNPIGVELQVRAGYQLRLHDRKKPLYRDNFLFLGMFPRINPAAIKIGPSIEVQPLSIFNLRFAAEYVNAFGTFNGLQSFGSPLSAYFDELLAENGELGRNYATHGAHLVVEPLLQGKLGPVAVRNKLSIEYWYMQLRGDDSVFYDAAQDTLLPCSGWLLTDDLDLLFFIRPNLVVGARYSLIKPLYRASDFRDGEDVKLEDNEHHRLGPVLSYAIYDRSGRRFNKPTLLLSVAWYLDHRYRTGAAQTAIIPDRFVDSRGIPCVILAFSFQADLLPLKAR